MIPLRHTRESGFWALLPILTLAFACLDDLAALFPGSLDAAPGLLAFYEGFGQRRGIAGCLASDRRPAAVQYGPGGKIFPAGT